MFYDAGFNDTVQVRSPVTGSTESVDVTVTELVMNVWYSAAVINPFFNAQAAASVMFLMMSHAQQDSPV
jgi:hypothetical protein